MTFYLDFERIRKNSGYVYWYGLIDLLKPDKDGDTFYIHKKPMGGGTGVTVAPKNPEWKYPNPNSMKELVLTSVCSK